MLEKQVGTLDDIEMNSTKALELLAERYVLNCIAVLLPCNVYHVVQIPVSGLFLVPRSLQDRTTLPV